MDQAMMNTVILLRAMSILDRIMEPMKTPERASLRSSLGMKQTERLALVAIKVALRDLSRTGDLYLAEPYLGRWNRFDRVFSIVRSKQSAKD